MSDDPRVTPWLSAVNAELTDLGADVQTRANLISTLLSELVDSRTRARTLDDLRVDGPRACAVRLLDDHRRSPRWVAVPPLIMTGLIGAAVGALVVWFGLYQAVTLELLGSAIDERPVALSLDVLAVGIVLGCAVAAVGIVYGHQMPTVTRRLGALAPLAALLAWPAISALGYSTGYSLAPLVLTIEITIGCLFLAAAVVAARAWSIRGGRARRAPVAG